MSDYIKREDAKDAVINIVGWEKIAKYVDEMSKHPSTKDIDYYDALMDAEDAIDDLPPADVAPVRHGHWVFNQDDMTLHCSRCDEVFRFEETEKDECLDFMEYAKYCLACGAVMDEEVDA